IDPRGCRSRRKARLHRPGQCDRPARSGPPRSLLDSLREAFLKRLTQLVVSPPGFLLSAGHGSSNGFPFPSRKAILLQHNRCEVAVRRSWASIVIVCRGSSRPQEEEGVWTGSAAATFSRLHSLPPVPWAPGSRLHESSGRTLSATGSRLSSTRR